MNVQPLVMTGNGPVAKQLQILLVEDNPDDAELTVRAFEKSLSGTSISVVRDGQEALDFLFAAGDYAERDGIALPRMVLLDLNLPKLSGIEVLQSMRANPVTRHVPVVVLTSSNEESDILRCYGCGANSYIRKPVDFARFLDAARQLGAYWLTLNEAPPVQRGSSA